MPADFRLTGPAFLVARNERTHQRCPPPLAPCLARSNDSGPVKRSVPSRTVESESVDFHSALQLEHKAEIRPMRITLWARRAAGLVVISRRSLKPSIPGGVINFPFKLKAIKSPGERNSRLEKRTTSGREGSLIRHATKARLSGIIITSWRIEMGSKKWRERKQKIRVSVSVRRRGSLAALRADFKTDLEY